MLDFIVVGMGIAGWSFIRLLQENGHSFIVFDKGKENSTLASAGLFNPVILKRFTLAWKAVEWLPYALESYRQFEKENPGEQFIYYLPIYRKLHSIREQNDWLSTAGRPGFERYMNGISYENIPGIQAPYGYGIMKNTGIIRTEALISVMQQKLIKNNLLYQETFRHEQLHHYEEFVEYNGIKARRIVFAEGYGMKHNPYFKYLPLKGTKGQSLEVSLSEPVSPIIKARIFLIPLPWNSLHLAGATYEWDDKTPFPTSTGRQHLMEKLKNLYLLPFEIKKQRAGIRPTVSDRRPLLGHHPVLKNLFILNGMGTRGVILAPKSAEMLYHYIISNKPLLPETNIRRFDGRY